MQSKGNRPNSAQKRWMDEVAAVGSIISGRKPVELHHVVGFTAKFEKQHIGPWWILPLTTEEHRHIGTAQGTDELSRLKLGFTMVGRFDYEKLLFSDLLTHFSELPFSDEVLQSIWSYRR